MSERLPEQFEPLRQAEQGVIYRGHAQLSRMRRLAPSLHDTDGAVEAEIALGRDEQRIPYLRGWIRANLVMVCQRCLEPVRVPIERSFALGLVRSEAEAERLPGEYEPLLVARGPMSMAEIIEDELILALPIVAVHAPGEPCAVRTPYRSADEDRPADADNPFAVLKELKHRD